MYKLMLFFFFLISNAFGFSSLPDRFTLSDRSCVLTGPESGKITSKSGQNVDLLCEKSKNEIKCSQIGKPAELYDLLFNEGGIILFRSRSGNIVLLGDLKGKTYTMAGTHLIAEAGIIMTKNCAGIMK